MIDDRDEYQSPFIDGFGSASTTSERPDKKTKRKKRRKIGFAIPKRVDKPK